MVPIAYELATAFISIVPEASKIRPAVEKELRGVEKSAEKSGDSMGSKMAAGLGGALKKTAIGVGVAGGAAIAVGLTKGIGRLNSIEQAQSKLLGLGNSATDVGNIMENALAAVKGTSFGLEEAATIAASAVAAGVKPGRDLERTLKLTGDAAAIAGVELSDMGSIVNQVATSDMMQMDTANQLMDAGIPILQMVAKEMGVTAGEASKLASDGAVSFEIFQNALEKGVGGAAAEMGNTTQGAFKNMGAAAGRLGATVAGPFFTQVGGAFRGITDLLDGMNKQVGPVMGQFGTWLEGSAIPALLELGKSARKAFAEFGESDLVTGSVTRLVGVFSSLAGTAQEVWPSLQKIGVALGDAAKALGVSGWDLFLTTLEAASAVAAAIAPPLEVIADLMAGHPGLVTAAAGAWLLFKTVPAIMGRIAPAFAPMATGAATARTSIAGFSGAVRDSYRWMGQANPAMSTLGKTASVMGGAAGAAAKGGLSALGRAGSSVMGVFGGPLGAAFTGVAIAAMAGVAANQKLNSSQKALQSASQDLAMAQTDMWSQIGSASGVADSVVDQIRAVRAEMDAAIAGQQRGFGAAMLEGWKNATSVDDFGEFFTGGDDGTAAKNAANKIADNAKLAKGALDELKLSNDDVAGAIRGSAGDWDSLAAKLRATKDGGMEALAGLQPLRDEYVLLQEAQRTATPGTLELSAAVDVLADSAASADDKLGAMEDALKAIGIMSSDAETSAFELAAAVEEVAKKAIEGAPAAGGMGKELLTLEGGLDGSKANAQALTGELDELGTKFRQHAQDTGDAAGAYDKVRPALESLATTYDLPIGKIEELAAKWGGIDKEAVDLLVRVDGADESRQKIVEAALALDQIPDGEPKLIKMRVEDEAARAALTDLGLKVTDIEGKPGMVTITADSTVAVAAMNMVAQRMGGLDASVATPDINANDTVFRLTDQSAQEALRNLDATHVDPSVGAIIDDFINGRDVTLAELQRIDGTVADPHITAEISEALQKAQLVNDNLDRAARPRTAYIDLVQRGSSQYDSSGTAVGQQYAGGGRLPLTGPGTNRTDGILGVGSDGQPTAWVDKGEWVVNGNSSQQYNGVLSAINRDDPSVRHLKGLANGGVAGDNFLDFVWARDGLANKPLEGAPYQWGQTQWGDCSGAMSAIARFATGLAPFGGRFATGSQREALLGMGFKLGRGGSEDLRFGWYNGGPAGGHTSGTLPDGTNVEMGGGRGNGQIGGGAVGANWSQYTDHAYLEVGPGWDWSDKDYTGKKGRGLVRGDGTVDPFTGQTTFTGKGGSKNSGQPERPTTWSGVAGEFAKNFAEGQTQDALGVFGIPDMMPPFLQAWNTLNEVPEFGGPTDWDLSVAAANVKKFDAQVQAQSAVVNTAAQALDAVTGSNAGDPQIGAVGAARAELEKLRQELLGNEMNRKAAEAHLADLVSTRAALIAEEEEGDTETDPLAEERASNSILDKEEALRKAREALSTAESKTGKDRDESKITSARGRLDKAERDLDLAKKKLEQDEAKANKAPAIVYNPAGGAEQWRPLVEKVLAEKGQPLEYADAVMARMKQESSGNPRAQNNDDSNAKAGTPSKGLMQPIDPTFQAYKDPGFEDIWDPEANIRASMNYVLRDPKFKGRSLRDVYMQAGGYWNGGPIPFGSGVRDDVPLVAAQGEFIVNRKAAAQNRGLLEQINSGRAQPAGGGATYNIYAFDLDEAMATTSRREAQHAQTYMGAR